MATLTDLKLELWLRQRNSGELRHVTRGGTEIPLKSMSDQHLVNAINFFERKYEQEEEIEFVNEWDIFWDKD